VFLRFDISWAVHFYQNGIIADGVTFKLQRFGDGRWVSLTIAASLGRIFAPFHHHRRHQIALGV